MRTMDMGNSLAQGRMPGYGRRPLYRVRVVEGRCLRQAEAHGNGNGNSNSNCQSADAS